MAVILLLFLPGLGQAESSFSTDRLHVLYIGDRGHHQPLARIKDVWGPLARAGIAVEWEEDLGAVTPQRLLDFDCVWMYANQAQNAIVPPKFFSALQGFVRKGGGFLALHCTSGCFMQSQAWLEFIGARFVSHGAEVFRQTVLVQDHPLLRGWQNFESGDETYVQTHYDGGREVLAMRGTEPWMWIRQEGQGRVFYCASGHDARTWQEPGFLDLLIRATDWTSGPEAAARRAAFRLPEFDYEEREFVPNYEEWDPRMLFQLPSTPAQAQAHLQPPAGMEARLFAAEPMVVNPIALDWDLRGRCWVIETPDYPNEVRQKGGTDRISILEDTNGDGVADKKTVFADGLNLPTGLLLVPDGVVVAMAPDLLLFRDTNGDDQEDERLILTSGFGRFDTHAGPSNLRFGPDNAIWGAVGYSAFSRKDGSRFGSGLWRLLPGAQEPQFMAQFTNNTWGLGLRDDGEVFGSTANGAPSFFVGANKLQMAISNPNHSGALPVHDTAWVFPALAEIRQGDWMGQYTAAAGHSFSTGSQLPTSWSDRSAFICGPTAHTVGRFDTSMVGAGWESRNALNLCASTDDWFCPVQASVGPDGAVWIADFSQFIILHNLPGNPERGLPKIEYGEGSAHLNPMRDQSHGRIWRLVRKEGAFSKPKIADSSPDSFLKTLGHPNRFLRTTARQHLIAEPPSGLTPSLVQLITNGPPLAAMEALRILPAMVSISQEEWKKVMSSVSSDSDFRVLVALLQTMPASDASANWLVESDVLNHASPSIRRHALLAASRMPESAVLGISLVSRAILESPEDTWMTLALRAAIVAHPTSFLKSALPLLKRDSQAPSANELPNPGFEWSDPAHPSDPLGWRERSYGGVAEVSWSLNGGRNGSRALRISSQTGADTSWCIDVPVRPNTRYRLGGWIRTEGLTHEGTTHGALMNVHPTRSVTESVFEDSGWTPVAVEFSTSSDQVSVSLNCLFGGWGKSIGAAYWDDVFLNRLGDAGGLESLLALANKYAKEGADHEPDAPMDVLLENGDATRGEQVFFQNMVLSCNRCHSLSGIGGGIGPPLDGVGSRLSKLELLQSILDPNARLAEGWKAPVSAMPALSSFMTEEELSDLISFLERQR